MGILDLFRRGRGRDAVTVYVSNGDASVLGMSPEQLYATQPALRAVVSFLAANIAQLPLKVYRRDDGTGDRRRIRDDAVALALARPAPGMTAYELMEATVTDLKLRGRAVWWAMESGETESGWAIRPIPAAWIEDADTYEGLEPSSFTVRSSATGRAIEIPADECVVFGYYNPAEPAGASSPVSALKDVLAEQVSAWRFRNQVWANGGRISGYIKRPLGAEWSNDARDKFAKGWAEYAGNRGARAGSTPLLEDGMEYVQTTLNAREAEWAEATQLTRQDVAAVYHVNPSLVWHSDAQTYASAKDNARALYADTLAPDLKMIADKINARLLPMLGAEPGEYAEFDLFAKLNGSFEEQAAQLYQATGAPYMAVSEARERLNLPYIEGTDTIARPLNIGYGDDLGEPIPTGDFDDLDEPAGIKCACAHALPAPAEAPVEIKGAPETADALAVARVMRRFYKRQGKAVVSKIDNPKMRAKADGDEWPAWWEAERWDRELADDLEPVLKQIADRRGRRAMRQMGLDADEYDADRTAAYIRAAAEGKAKAANNVTYRELVRAIEGDIGEDAEGATPRGVFDKAETDRADMQGTSFATAILGFAVMEAARQGAPGRRKTKTWVVTSGNPRPEHAAMNGETVPMDEEFSNGAMYPGDQTLTPDESCGCQCVTQVTIY